MPVRAASVRGLVAFRTRSEIFEVGGGNPPLRAGTRDGVQCNPKFARPLAGGRRGEGSAVGRHRCGGRGSGRHALQFQLDQRCTDGDLLTDLAMQSRNPAGDGGCHLHRRFIGHDIDHRLVFLQPFAGLDVPGGDFRLSDAFADIGQAEDIVCHAQPSCVRRKAAATRPGPGK